MNVGLKRPVFEVAIRKSFRALPYAKKAVKAIMKKEEKAVPEKARVQFDFTLDALDKLDHIKDATNASTRAEVIRQALKLYIKVLEADQRGARVMFEEKDGRQAELMLL
ncbi:MAG: ribbon-helix-helix protein, CopG family [Pyrinomonadaceae bacterium]